jgi:hypothetical protein
VVATGLITDELNAQSTLATQVDQRVIPSNGSDFYPYVSFSKARMAILGAIGTLEQYSPSSRAKVAELFAYLGSVEVMFAEDLCSGVPLGYLNNGQPAAGPALTRTQMTLHAVTYFDSALTYSVAGDSVNQFALIGKGRALLNLDSVSAAAATVAPVQSQFAYQIQYDPTGAAQTNSFYGDINLSLNFSISDREGENGLDFISAQDPRLVVDSAGIGGFSGQTIYGFQPYSNLGSPITIASGAEASLIEAEAELRGGQIDKWAATLNALRASFTPGIQPLSSDSTTNASDSLRIKVLFRERAFWLFGTGHRLGDLRRLVRTYGFNVADAFPSGLYQGGPNEYGSDVTFVPTEEFASSAYHGCFDRNP